MNIENPTEEQLEKLKEAFKKQYSGPRIWRLFEKSEKPTGIPSFNAPPPPKSREFQTILRLLHSAENWKDAGDKEFEGKIWAMVSDRAKEYADEAAKHVNK